MFIFSSLKDKYIFFAIFNITLEKFYFQNDTTTTGNYVRTFFGIIYLIVPCESKHIPIKVAKLSESHTCHQCGTILLYAIKSALHEISLGALGVGPAASDRAPPIKRDWWADGGGVKNDSGPGGNQIEPTRNRTADALIIGITFAYR